MGIFLIIVFIIILSAWLSVLIHELGHIFFSLILGGKISEIKIGYGKKVLDFYIKDTEVIVGLKFFRSSVTHTKVKSMYKNLLITMGGPLFNILAFIITFLFFNYYNKENQIINIFLFFMVIWNQIMSVLGLVSNNPNSDGGKIIILLKLIFNKIVKSKNLV